MIADVRVEGYNTYTGVILKKLDNGKHYKQIKKIVKKYLRSCAKNTFLDFKWNKNIPGFIEQSKEADFSLEVFTVNGYVGIGIKEPIGPHGNTYKVGTALEIRNFMKHDLNIPRAYEFETVFVGEWYSIKRK